ncbi:hypothetical protein CS557_12650 [Acinetobacter junii]|uniref:hypothetical protein n=1 Tax=Acinetobacter junii TaxID=40215 RepID=UPI000C1B2562|nr:hypothetical protein [Acinetobacter junii]ATU46284.1 hypothetical protein CS557_12650 [Acinetobacter junii]
MTNEHLQAYQIQVNQLRTKLDHLQEQIEKLTQEQNPTLAHEICLNHVSDQMNQIIKFLSPL